MSQTGIALIGCGFVADYYVATLEKYPNLKVVGVYDKNADRLKTFCEYYSLNALNSIEDILSHNDISIVLNLTDPRSHYAISKQCLEAGKHVYSEKPLAMDYEDAKELVDLAKQKGLQISSAPCSVPK